MNPMGSRSLGDSRGLGDIETWPSSGPDALTLTNRPPCKPAVSWARPAASHVPHSLAPRAQAGRRPGLPLLRDSVLPGRRAGLRGPADRLPFGKGRSPVTPKPQGPKLLWGPRAQLPHPLSLQRQHPASAAAAPGRRAVGANDDRQKAHGAASGAGHAAAPSPPLQLRRRRKCWGTGAARGWVQIVVPTGLGEPGHREGTLGVVYAVSLMVPSPPVSVLRLGGGGSEFRHSPPNSPAVTCPQSWRSYGAASVPRVPGVQAFREGLAWRCPSHIPTGPTAWWPVSGYWVPWLTAGAGGDPEVGGGCFMPSTGGGHHSRARGVCGPSALQGARRGFPTARPRTQATEGLDCGSCLFCRPCVTGTALGLGQWPKGAGPGQATPGRDIFGGIWCQGDREPWGFCATGGRTENQAKPTRTERLAMGVKGRLDGRRKCHEDPEEGPQTLLWPLQGRLMHSPQEHGSSGLRMVRTCVPVSACTCEGLCGTQGCVPCSGCPVDSLGSVPCGAVPGSETLAPHCPRPRPQGHRQIHLRNRCAHPKEQGWRGPPFPAPLSLRCGSHELGRGLRKRLHGGASRGSPWSHSLWSMSRGLQAALRGGQGGHRVPGAR